MVVAGGLFGPSIFSKLTLCPSVKPSPRSPAGFDCGEVEKYVKTAIIRAKPLLGLNHFTVPVAMSDFLL